MYFNNFYFPKKNGIIFLASTLPRVGAVFHRYEENIIFRFYRLYFAKSYKKHLIWRNINL